MSVTSEHLTELQQSRNQWAERFIDYKARGARYEKAVGRAIDSTRQFVTAKERREQVRKRLESLQKLAGRFGEVAASGDHELVRTQIGVVVKRVDLMDWDGADKAIDEAQRLIDEGAKKLDDVVALKLRAGKLSDALEQLRGQGCGDEFLRVHSDLSKLDPLIRPATTQQAQRAAQALELAIQTLAQHIEEEKRRIEDLHKRRVAALITLPQLAQRGLEAGAEAPLLQAIRKAEQDLKDLADSRAEAVLQRAVDSGESAIDKTWTPEVVRLEAAKARRERQDRLAEMRLELKQLLSDSAAERSKAIPALDDEPQRLVTALQKLLDEKDGDDLDTAQLLWFELKEALAFQAEQMEDVRAKQATMRTALAKYEEFAEEPQPKPWKALEKAFKELPEVLQDPQGDGWETADEWEPGLDDDIDAFLRALKIYRAQAGAADQGEALQEVKHARDKQRQKFDSQKRFATKVQVDEAKDRFDTLAALLSDKVGLDEDEESEALEILERLEALNGEITTSHAEGRKASINTDKADKGHSIKRHGPEVTEEQLKSRLSTGRGPDGVLSPTKRSTRFLNYHEWELTRQAAFDKLQRKWGSFGAKLDQKPPNALNSKIVIVDHQRPIGEGFKGDGKGRTEEKSFPGRPDDKYTLYKDFKPLPPLTKTKTTIEWNGSRWVAAQHFPIQK